MKPLIIIIVIYLFIHSNIKAQSNWADAGVFNHAWGVSSIYNDTINDFLYVGNFNLNAHAYETVVMRYNGIVWDTLPGIFNNSIIAITMHNGEIYVGGAFKYIDDTLEVNSIAKWNGSYWENVGNGLFINSVDCGHIQNLRSLNDTLYAVGYFHYSGDTIISLNGLAKWDGNDWIPVYNLPLLDVSANLLSDIAYYKGELYVAGNFSDGVTWADIVKYDGNNWVNVDYGIYGGLSAIEILAVYNDELYVAGSIYKSAGNAGSFIQRWDGTEWKDVGGGVFGYSGDIYSNGQIHDMKTHNGELYVGGVFMYAGGVPAPHVAKWDGTEWCGFGGVFNNNVTNVGFYHDTLFIAYGGDMIDNVSINHLARWVGGNYIDTCGVINNVFEIENERDDIVVYPNPASNTLYIKINKEIQKLSVSIYNVTGKKVYENDFVNIGNKIIINNLKTEKGLYFVKIETDKFIVVKKLLLN